MTSVDSYYFDVLPVHFRSEYLEALTGYLSRIAVANAIQSFTEIKKLGALPASADIIKTQKDFPLEDWGELPTALITNVETLNLTTFHHLLNKFGYSNSGSRAIEFLKGSLAEHLRFCPCCLADENGYYSLTWRFNLLKGCPKHNYYLLEQYTECHLRIELLPNPFSFGICPNCKQLLQKCAALSLSRIDQIEVSQVYQSLEFLLTPQPCEDKARELIPVIGKRLRAVRKRHSASISQWAARLVRPRKEIVFVEDGRTKDGIATLATYFAYIKNTDFTWPELFQ